MHDINMLGDIRKSAFLNTFIKLLIKRFLLVSLPLTDGHNNTFLSLSLD